MPEPVNARYCTPVVIVGAQRVMRAGLDAWLRCAQPGIVIIGHFDGAAEFTSAHPTATPGHVVLIDVPCRPEGRDFGALRSICAAGHRVVAYTCRCGDDVATASLDAGALGCVGRDEPEYALFKAIHAARHGCPRPPAPAVHGATPDDVRRGTRPQLSPREREVLVAWFRTENKYAVAGMLYIEPTTVATHLQRVRGKYAAVGRPATTKAALVARAIQDGILSVDDL
jgi:DNA-binding NarL/FixJ family response regulator